MGYNPWGHKESDTTERLHFTSLHVLDGNFAFMVCLGPFSLFVPRDFGG